MSALRPRPSPEQRVVTLLTRVGCHLCDVAQGELRALRAELGFGYREVDVDTSPVLRDTFGDRVPVIMIDGAEHGYWRLEEERFRAALARPPARRP